MIFLKSGAYLNMFRKNIYSRYKYVIQEGKELTVMIYGACLHIAVIEEK